MNEFLPLLVVVGLGGVVIYLLTRQPTPTQYYDRSGGSGQCGASYAGVGASVPCDVLFSGIKTLGAKAEETLRPLTQELKTATSGFGVADVAIAPVGATHAVYNETKRALNYLNPF